MSDQRSSIHIDIISDVVCPWCVIGYGQLRKAMAEFGEKARFTLDWRAFELNPQMSEAGENLRAHLNRKYGTTPEQSAAARARLAELGRSLGFTFDYHDDMRVYNTFKAHQLLCWARERGRQTELKSALFAAYFTRREDISSVATLVDVAGRAGLDKTQAEAALRDGRYEAAVRDEERQWLNRGVHAVPAFIFDHQYALSGAQEPETFTGLFEKLLAEKATPNSVLPT